MVDMWKPINIFYVTIKTPLDDKISQKRFLPTGSKVKQQHGSQTVRMLELLCSHYNLKKKKKEKENI